MTIEQAQKIIAVKHNLGNALVTGHKTAYFSEAAELYAAAFAADLAIEIAKLKKFKDYVHNRLDAIGVPSDPEPEKNKATGCRIEGRLNFVERNIWGHL